MPPPGRNVQFETTIIKELLVSWNRMMYYSLASPFKVVLHPSGKAELLYSRGRVVFLCILTVLRVLYLLQFMQAALRLEHIQGNPTVLYRFGILCVNILITAAWTAVMTSRATMCKLLEAIELCMKHSSHQKSSLKEKCGPGLLLIFPLLTVAALIISQLIKLCSGQGCHMLYASRDIQSVQLATWMNFEPSGNFGVQIVLSFAGAIIHVATLTIFWMSITYTCLLAFVLVYTLSKESSRYLEENGDILDVHKIYAFHMELHALMGCVNKVFSPAVISITAGYVMYAVTYFLCMLHMKTVNGALTALLEAWGCSLLVLAAYSDTTLRKTITIVQQKGRVGTLTERLNAHLLVQDMKENPVELKAFIFTINYNLLVTLVTSILTYIIIWLQFAGPGVKQEC